MPYDEYYEEEEWAERVEMFADPGGNSALRAASTSNPRNLPCPTCKWPNRLTPADRARGYQCNACADAMEYGTDIHYYEGEAEDPADRDEFGHGLGEIDGGGE